MHEKTQKQSRQTMDRSKRTDRRIINKKQSAKKVGTEDKKVITKEGKTTPNQTTNRRKPRKIGQMCPYNHDPTTNHLQISFKKRRNIPSTGEPASKYCPPKTSVHGEYVKRISHE